MNIWAVLLAAVSSFMLGGLWYSPMLFEPTWNKENGGVTQAAHPGKVFGTALVFALVSAFAFAWLLGPAPALDKAVTTGLVVGLGMVAASFGINYQFAQRSIKLLLIDGGYHTLQFVVFGVVLGLWH